MWSVESSLAEHTTMATIQALDSALYQDLSTRCPEQLAVFAYGLGLPSFKLRVEHSTLLIMASRDKPRGHPWILCDT